MRNTKLTNLVFILIIIAAAIYAGLFIYKSSFIIEGERYFTLFDDPMVSMQYAKNLARGNGLVWNSGGERVEGFTNPLWVLFMAIFHLFPIPLSKICLAIQISGAVFMLINLWFVKMIADELSDCNSLVSILAVLITAFYYPLINWDLLGNEVSLLTLMISTTVWLALRCMRQGKTSMWLYLLMGLGTLVRIDATVLFVVILSYMAFADPQNKRKNLLWGGSILATFLILQTLFRLWYYGDILPNTYYLKMIGGPTLLRIFRGLFVFIKFIWNFNWALFLLPFFVFIIHRRKSTDLLMLVVIAQCLYSIYVGGDAWEHRGGSNRFLAITMPLIFVLIPFALERIRLLLMGLLNISRTSHILELISRSGVVFFALIGLLNFNALLDTRSLSLLFLQGQPLYVRGNERNTTIGLYVRSITTEQAKVAFVGAGAAPYYSERYSIDLLGKSDIRIAHGEMNIPDGLPLIDFRPGHMKWSYEYSIGELKPDVVVEIWGGTNDEAAPFLADYVRIQHDPLKVFLPNGILYLRKGSIHVLWDEVSNLIIDS